MVAGLRVDPGRDRPARDHLIGIGLGQGCSGQPISAPPDRAEQRPPRVRVQPAPVDIGVEVGLEVMVAGHLMPLAALLVQAHPQPSALGEHVLHLHAGRRPDAGEAIDHEADQRPIA